MHVELAENGREAIEKIATRRYDAIVLDLLMPGIDGFGVLEYLDRCQPDLLSYTIISSGLPQKYQERVMQYGVRGVLPKPLDQHKLQEMIESCMTAERAENDPKRANGS